MSCQPLTHVPVLLLTCNWITSTQVNSSQTFVDENNSQTDSKICGPRGQKITREHFCAGGPCAAGGCDPSCNWWPQHWCVITEEGITVQTTQPHSQHSAPLSTLTTSHTALCTQALSTKQGHPVPWARLKATTQCERRAMSSATETAASVAAFLCTAELQF